MADTETARYARWQAHGRSTKNRRNRLILEELVDWWREITCPSDVTGVEGKYTHPNRAGAARIEGGGLGTCPASGQMPCASTGSQFRRMWWLRNEGLAGLVQTDQERSKRESSETGLRVKVIYSTMRAAFQVRGHRVA